MAVTPQEIRVVLRDGTRALIRPIQPGDKDRLQQGLGQVSPRTRFLRFHADVDRLTDEQLRYLTEVDQRDHLAWVALNEDAPDEPGMGVARCIRLPGEPEVAEAAVTVHDAYQGRGLGTVLLGVLARMARTQGIRVFRSYVLAANEAMLSLLRDLGADQRPETPDVHRVDLRLPDDLDDVPDTPAGRTLRAAAAGRLRLLVSPWVPLRIPESGDLEDRDGEEAPLLRMWLDSEMGEDR
jgi:GNAT superfamily N-acetyltransferase